MTNQPYTKTLFPAMFAAVMLLSCSSLFAQVKIGTNPTTINAANNLEVEASTTGRKTSIDKTTGKVTIADGSQGSNKVLTSDVNGVATWENVKLTAFAGSTSQVRQNLTASAGPSTFEDVIFQAEAYDPSNSFTPSTGTFTAPVAGFYQVFGSTQFDNNEVPGLPIFYAGCLKLFVNNSILVGQACTNINTVVYSCSVSNIVFLNQGDTVNLKAGAVVASGATFGIVVSSFYAYKISD